MVPGFAAEATLQNAVGHYGSSRTRIGVWPSHVGAVTAASIFTDALNCMGQTVLATGVCATAPFSPLCFAATANAAATCARGFGDYVEDAIDWLIKPL
jgi:hypothetical protein